MQYDNYLKSLSEKFERRLEDISAEHNFELGNEFEIAICEILRDFLPTKYGICRGFVVDVNGQKAGDDIIIYDQERFPTLKINKKNDFSRKEEIPIEAVYAYIEAKHKLTADTLIKAIDQVTAVKKLCSTRDKMAIGQFDPYIFPNNNSPLKKNKDYPEHRNPIFTLILSRHVEDTHKKSDEISVANFFIASMNYYNENKTPFLPEVIVAGKNLSASIGYQTDTTFKLSKFLLENDNYGIRAMLTKGTSYGFALANLAHALDWIRLGKMPWTGMLNEIVHGSKDEIIKYNSALKDLENNTKSEP